MSRIWDALKDAERQRVARAIRTKDDSGKGKRPADRRRSKRFLLSAAVLVYGHAKNAEPFYEAAHTLEVNANGGLLNLATSVRPGQKLLLTNMITEEEQECRVVRVGPKRPEQTPVAIEFTRRAVHFWRTNP